MASGKALLLKRETAVKLFEHLGFKTVKKWDSKRLLTKIKNLPELTDDVKIKNPKVKKLLDAILAAKKVAFKEVEVGSKDAVAPKATKKIKAAKKEVKKAPKENKKGLDKFGTRLGTNRAKINAVLSKTPKTMEQLMKKAGVGYAPGEHMQALVTRKLVKVTDQGYCLR